MKYRLLEIGEVVKAGDETKDFPGQDWEAIAEIWNEIKVENGELFRRPLPEPTFEESANFDVVAKVSHEAVSEFEISQHSADEVIYATKGQSVGIGYAQNKYSREIAPGVWVDVYDVLDAFNVTNPALQHLLKKALAVGQRGHKDAEEDYQDIIDSAIRAKKLG